MADPVAEESIPPRPDIDGLEKPLLRRFEALGITVDIHRHVALHTVAESQQMRGSLPGGHIKNLFLRDKKRRQWLVTVAEDRRVDLKVLRRTLETSGNLSFGSTELLHQSLGVTPGSVTPFAVMNDPSGDVIFVLDRGLLSHETINAHPMHNEATVAIGRHDLLRFLTDCDHHPVMVDFDKECYQIYIEDAS